MASRSSATTRANGSRSFRIRLTSCPYARPNSAFAKAYPEFKKLNCELLGLSIDSYYAHVAWVLNMKEKFGVDIPFPTIEDLSMRVANAYGMIQPGASDTSAVRSTFLIDDKGVLRAMVYYLMTNGRSISEFLRLVAAMQTTDKHRVSTPDDWYFCKKAVTA